MSRDFIIYVIFSLLISIILIMSFVILKNYRKIQDIENDKSNFNYNENIYSINDKLTFETSKSIVEYLNDLKNTDIKDMKRDLLDIIEKQNENTGIISENQTKISENKTKIETHKSKFNLMESMVHYDYTKMSIRLITLYQEKYGDAILRDKIKQILVNTNIFNIFELITTINMNSSLFVEQYENEVLLVFKKILETYNVEYLNNNYKYINTTLSGDVNSNIVITYMSKYSQILSIYFSEATRREFFLNIYLPNLIDYINITFTTNESFEIVDDLILEIFVNILRYLSDGVNMDQYFTIDDIFMDLNIDNILDSDNESTVNRRWFINIVNQMDITIPFLNGTSDLDIRINQIMKKALFVIIPYYAVMMKYCCDYTDKFKRISEMFIESIESDDSYNIDNSNIYRLYKILNMFKCKMGEDKNYNLMNQGLLKHLSNNGTYALESNSDVSTIVQFNKVINDIFNSTVSANAELISLDNRVEFLDFVCCDISSDDLSKCWSIEN